MDERETVAPVINDLAGLAMGPLGDPRMLANRLPISDHDQPFGIDMQPDTAVRKAGGNAVALRRGQQSTGLLSCPSSRSKVIRHVGDTRLLCSIKPSNAGGRAISLGFSASHTSFARQCISMGNGTRGGDGPRHSLVRYLCPRGDIVLKARLWRDPSPRSNRIGRLQRARTPKARRCRALSSVPLDADLHAMPGRKLPRVHRSHHIPASPDQHAFASLSATFCVTSASGSKSG